MKLVFISREVYRTKHSLTYLKHLKAQYGSFYLLPEGGTNTAAIKGCEEILNDNDQSFNYICCAVGTGGTISGIINSSSQSQHIIGFPALKGSFLQEDICKFANNLNWHLVTNYHFGGYGKTNDTLIEFINQFKKDYDILLDPIYTGKMMYGILDLIKKGNFKKNSQILAIHTGGLQGIIGINNKLAKKNKPLINLN